MYKGLDHYRNLPSPLAIGVSGGRSSAYQLAHIIEANGGVPEGAICTFENTGLELPETYDFLDRLDRHFSLDLRWLEYDPTSASKVKRVSYATAARNGEPFNDLLTEIVPKRRDGSAGVRPLPNPVQRSCTSALKIKTVHRYLRRQLGWSTNYWAAIGYRADEKARYDRRVLLDAKGWPEGGKAVCPMYHAGADTIDVGEFWQWMPFDLEILSEFGNCDFCFMASGWKIKLRMERIAELEQIKPAPGGPIPLRIVRWIGWEERESDRPGLFRKDRPSVRQLWDEVCRGDLLSVGNGNMLECGTCTD